ncbi:MAG: type II toxin-antitoxin system VapC family toxin [Tepidisphaeraceae bacterium]
MLDASIAGAWHVPGEHDDAAEHALRRTLASGAHVPAIWTLEIANLLLMAERRKRLSEADSARIFELLREMPIAIEAPPDIMAAQKIARLAKQLGLTAYDAAYLELAMRLRVPLATLDKDLQRVAKASHVELL